MTICGTSSPSLMVESQELPFSPSVMVEREAVIFGSDIDRL
jgi:hypothetical protein